MISTSKRGAELVEIHNNRLYIFSIFRPTNKAAAKQPNGKGMEVGIADDQAKDFDFEKTEMKYDSTGMFHWTPGHFSPLS